MKPSATETEIAAIRRTIEELDIKYQLAVKNNDVETMDDILADDFVLITGRGKAYTKSDLLDDARRRTTIYEHQEDSDRTVERQLFVLVELGQVHPNPTPSVPCWPPLSREAT